MFHEPLSVYRVFNFITKRVTSPHGPRVANEALITDSMVFNGGFTDSMQCWWILCRVTDQASNCRYERMDAIDFGRPSCLCELELVGTTKLTKLESELLKIIFI